MKSYMIRIKAETMGAVKYVVEISTADDLNSEIQTKRYEERSGLSQDLIDCLPQFGDSEQLLRTVDQQKSLILSETPIELTERLCLTARLVGNHSVNERAHHLCLGDDGLGCCQFLGRAEGESEQDGFLHRCYIHQRGRRSSFAVNDNLGLGLLYPTPKVEPKLVRVLQKDFNEGLGDYARLGESGEGRRVEENIGFQDREGWALSDAHCSREEDSPQAC